MSSLLGKFSSHEDTIENRWETFASIVVVTQIDFYHNKSLNQTLFILDSLGLVDSEA